MSAAGTDPHRGDSDRGLAAGPVQRWQPPAGAPDPALVLRLAGHRSPETAPPPVAEAAERVAVEAGALADPAAWWRAVPVTFIAPAALPAPRAALRASREPLAWSDEGAPARVRLGRRARFSGLAVAAHLEGCRLAVAFALTVGGALEAEVARLEEAREPLDAYLLDRAGWAIIETAVRGLRLYLRARARRGGGQLTHRLAPGYADWPLEEQPGLLALLGPLLPVELNAHGVLVPFKSVTGLFGVRTGPPDRSGSLAGPSPDGRPERTRRRG